MASRLSSPRAWRPIVARLLAVCGSVLVTLLALEIGLRLFGATPRGESAFATYTNDARVFQLVEENGTDLYVRTADHWIPGGQRFRAEKDPRAIRIFGVGGSAAMGWPHPPGQSYLGLLDAKLRRLYPEREIEVINAAGNTYASYRIARVVDEIVAYDPDLLLIWVGNNEFLENFVYRTDQLPGPLQHSALARFVHDRLRSDEPKPTIDLKNIGQADRVSTRLSFAFGRAARLREDPAQLRQVIEHYRYNMESMVRAALARGVPVMLLDVPVNLKDWRPNVSVHRPDLSADELARFTAAFRRGTERLEQGDPQAALAAFEEAVEIDPGYALAQYRLGQARHRRGDLAGARRAYVEALRADAYPFRSLPEFDAIRRDIAREHEVPLVETVSALEGAADDGILGLDVLVDYVHPTIAGNEIIAQAVLQAMDVAGLLPQPRALPVEDARIAVAPDAEEDLGVLFALQSQYLIMRQYDQLGPLSDRLLAAARAAVAAQPEHAGLLPPLEERVALIRRVIEPYRALLRAEELGTLEQSYTRAEAERIYTAYIDMIRRLEAGKMKPEEFDRLVPPLPYGNAGATPAAAAVD